MENKYIFYTSNGHYYRYNNVDKTILHINTNSILINKLNYFDLSFDIIVNYIVTNEDDFNQALNEILEKLGISGINKFKL